jgi:hypothetical protein
MSRDKPRVCGQFVPDPDTPADPFSGAQVCANCHLVGAPGDAHHTLPDVPEMAEHRRWVGEDGDER